MQQLHIVFLLLAFKTCAESKNAQWDEHNLWGAVSTHSLCAAGWPSPICEDYFDENVIPTDQSCLIGACHTSSKDPDKSNVGSDRNHAPSTSNIINVRIVSPTNGSIRFGAFAVRYTFTIAFNDEYAGKGEWPVEFLVDGAPVTKQPGAAAAAKHEWGGVFFPPALAPGWHRVAVRVPGGFGGEQRFAEAAAEVLVRWPPR